MHLKGETGHYYTIGHIVQITGLTDRTIRNYIKNGILQGELINGLWHFTGEQANAFINNPAVRPSILAKRNGKVHDFLASVSESEHRCCLIFDFPGCDCQKAAEFFCYEINHGAYRDLSFSIDCYRNVPRVILTGHTSQILELVTRFYAQH